MAPRVYSSRVGWVGMGGWVSLLAFVHSSPLRGPASSVVTTLPRQSAGEPSGLDTQESLVYGESQASRTLYTVVSLACMSLLAGMLGYRTRYINWHDFKNLSFTKYLMIILYGLAMSFVTSAAIVESALGLASSSLCHAAIILCLSFYMGSKVTMYIFLVERAHALRAPYMSRHRDWIWLGGMLTIVCGFGSIAICGFVWPLAELSQVDGHCRIGLPYKVTIPLLSFDIVINTALTGIFIYLLRPLLRFGGMSNEAVPASRFTKGMRRILKSSGAATETEVFSINRSSFKSIERLLWRSFIGSVLVMLPTVGNISALLPLRGQEPGWLCLTICTVDVTWAVCVIHWLMIGSTELDGRVLILLAQQSDFTSNVSGGTNSNQNHDGSRG